MQCERHEDLYREESSSNKRPKNQQQPKYKGKRPSIYVNMVFILPIEFLAPSSDAEEIVFSNQIAQLALDPMMAVF